MNTETNWTVANYNKSNDPNPATTCEALRCTGYTYFHALADIPDNSIDADAENIFIKVGTVKGGIEISVADDGYGMDMETLDEAMKLGGLGYHGESDLGKFGMGLVTASISIARQLTVITLRDKAYSTGIFDLDEVQRQNKWDKYLEESTQQEIELFHKMVSPDATSGTVVILRKCDKLTCNQPPAIATTLMKHLGETFRRFIMAGRNIYVNGNFVAPIDPLKLDDKYTEVVVEGGYTSEHKGIPVECVVNGVPTIEYVKYRMVLVNEGDADNNMRNQGFYIIRNQRQICSRFWVGTRAKHNSLNRVRIELEMTTPMDDQFGIEFTKRDITLTQSLVDKIESALNPHITSFLNTESKRTKEVNVGDIDKALDRASKIVRDKKKLLPTSKNIQKETRDEGNGSEQERKERSDKGKDRNFVKGRPGGVPGAKFEIHHFGKSGAIYEAMMDGHVVVVQVNMDHPFYDKFAKDQGDNDVTTSASLLLYAMARAELEANKDSEAIMRNIKTTISTVVNTLYS